MITIKRAEEIARTFLEERLPNKVGKTRRVFSDKRPRNQYWTNLVQDASREDCFVAIFEKGWAHGHWYEVYVDYEGNVIGGGQCR